MARTKAHALFTRRRTPVAVPARPRRPSETARLAAPRRPPGTPVPTLAPASWRGRPGRQGRRRLRAILAIATVAIAALGRAGCGAVGRGPGTVTLTVTPDFTFEPREVVVRPGDEAEIVLVNGDDRLPHELRSGGRLGPDLRLAPGERRQWRWTAPAEPGAIVFWCGMPGHRKNGMAGRIVIRATR